MAAGWPTKVSYANGDVFAASDINDTNGTLNYINPTSATDKQVLTRDNASGGKVKWADSPANTLTTTGDLYYASGANTPARLGIGTTGQVLTVAGGLPSWAGATNTFTKIGSTVSFSAVSSQAFDSVFSATYPTYWINIEKMGGSSSTASLYLNFRYGTTTYSGNRHYGQAYSLPASGANTSTQFNAVSQITLASGIGPTGAADINGGYFFVRGVANSSYNQMGSGAYNNGGTSTGWMNVFATAPVPLQSMTGFLLSASSGTITGTVSIYGVS